MQQIALGLVLVGVIVTSAVGPAHAKSAGHHRSGKCSTCSAPTQAPKPPSTTAEPQSFDDVVKGARVKF
jgi:hypothetical protein